MAQEVENLVGMLRAAGDHTRLRLLLLLLESELTVTELTQIVGQSQPRVSRHLKLLCEAGLIERFKEGTWVFYRGADQAEAGAFAASLVPLADTDDAVLARDKRKLADVRAARAAASAAYFKANAQDWQRLRSLHADDGEVEAAIMRLLGQGPLDAVLDAGTGTGRMLEVLAPHIRRGVGIDVSPEMLGIARDTLTAAGAAHCSVRLGDVYRLPLGDKTFDAVIFHQVMHYLEDPQAALREALRVLKPEGRVIIADFAPHELEFLRDEHAHRRLGFSDREVQGWFQALGLKSVAAESLAPKGGAEKLTVMVWLGKAQDARTRNAEAA